MLSALGIVFGIILIIPLITLCIVCVGIIIIPILILALPFLIIQLSVSLICKLFGIKNPLSDDEDEFQRLAPQQKYEYWSDYDR